MVEVAPFKALRKATRKKNDVSSFICPPYDVISKDDRAKIVRKYPRNVVNLELPSGTGETKYIQASKILREWKDEDAIQLDRSPSFYLLETTYKTDDPFAPSKKCKRYGVLAALRLEIPGRGKVRPHEKTLPKAKEDRLNLLSSVRTTISPIFGLFFDKKKEWKRWVARATKKKVIAKGVESTGSAHRMWKIEDPVMHKKLSQILKKKELFIADGHHRYEVSWAYKEIRLKADPSAPRNRGWQYVMTYVCPMEETGLLMLPTHRFVKTAKSFDQWMDILESFFDVRAVKNWNALVKSLTKSKPSQKTMGWVAKGKCYLLKMKKKISLDRCLSHRPPALRALDVVFLHDILLDEKRGAQYIKDKTIFYTQDIKGMVSKSKKDSSWVGFVLRSAGVKSLANVASSGEVMPPKTTYFYPKVPTGFTLMPLDQNIN